MKSTKITSFFAPKPSTSTSSTTPTTTTTTKEHHSDGRFQFFCFDDLDVIQTYVPNNGMKSESFARRRVWDHDMLLFLQERQQILDYVAKHVHDKGSSASTTTTITSIPRRLLWCGDMNCAREYRDGTHWEWRKSSSGRCSSSSSHDQDVYEWWTDESKCLAYGVQLESGRALDDIGMPSFTPAERRRFSELLRTGDFVDVWRDLHPHNGSRRRSNNNNDNDVDSHLTNNELSPWERPEWTWRGHLGKNGVKSKYEGTGQRLDYFLLSPSSSKTCVERCDILGYGTKREGLFCGSDHCASILVLKDDS